jgi:hypothetical protein
MGLIVNSDARRRALARPTGQHRPNTARRACHHPLARPPLTCVPPACTRSVGPPPVRPSHARALARCAPNRLLPAQPFGPCPFKRPTPVWARLVNNRASAIHAFAAAYAPARCASTRIVLACHLRACLRPRACARPPRARVPILLPSTPPPSCAHACAR